MASAATSTETVAVVVPPAGIVTAGPVVTAPAGASAPEPVTSETAGVSVTGSEPALA
ncbi:hypothetical protein ACFQ0B_11140 [Nonomuraea thailandensis]